MSKISKVSNQCTIDSMQVRIPLSDLSKHSSSLTDNTYLVTSTGEVISELTSNRKHQVGDKGLSLQIKGIRHKGRENIDCLVIGAPSKILGSQYFDGITNDSFRIIYDAIIGSGLVGVSMDALLSSGIATDFDIKKDSYFPGHMDFGQYCYHLKRQAKPTTDIGKGCKVYNNVNDGRGIQFSTRKTATAAYPFLKLYDKARELHTKSLSFTRECLPSYDITGLVRAEVTVKNRQQFKRVIKSADNSLGAVLSLSSNEMQMFLTHAQQIHIDKVTAYRPKSTEYTAMSLTLYRAVSIHLDSGMSFSQIQNLLLEGRDKVDKSRTKKLLNEMHAYYLGEKKDALDASCEGIDLIGHE